MDFAASSRKAGEAEMERLVAAYGTAVKRMCLLYLHDLSLAEDAAQETFLKAWRAYDTFRGDASEKTWLMRIAINTCKDMRRSAWFRHVDRSVAPETLPEPAAPCSTEDDFLTRAVMGLPPRCKAAALLCWYQGMTGQEAARALGVSRTTVQARLNKARKILEKEREAMERE